MALPNVMCVGFSVLLFLHAEDFKALEKKSFCLKDLLNISAKSFMLKKSCFIFSWLTHFIRDE